MRAQRWAACSSSCAPWWRTPSARTATAGAARRRPWRRSGATDVSELKSQLEASNFAALKALPPATTAAFTRFDLHQCPQCRATTTLTAKGVTVVTKTFQQSAVPPPEAAAG